MNAKKANTTASARKRPRRLPQPEARENFVPPEVDSFLAVILAKFRLQRLAGTGFAGTSWTAPAERSDNGAFAQRNDPTVRTGLPQSGVALRLPPHSKTRRAR